MAKGTIEQTTTMAFAPPSERSPAAIGRNGLLTRSISTSVIWLTPTIAMFTVRAATSVASRSRQAGRRSGLGGGDRVQADDRQRGADDRVRPREAPEDHERVRGRGDGRRGHAAARLSARRARSASAAAIGTNTAPAAEPATNRAAKRSRPLGASSAGAGRAAGDGPGGRLDAADGERVGHAGVAVPVRRQRPHAHVGEPRLLHPAHVVRLRREEHPRLGQRAGHPVRRADRADDQRHAVGARHAVGLGDPAQRVGPVLDRTGRDVAIERVVGERAGSRRRRARAGTPRAPAWRASA